MYVRGKPVTIERHAAVGMAAERPPIQPWDLLAVLEAPDEDAGNRAHKRLGFRTIIVYYAEDEQELFVRSVSATRRRFST